MSATREGQDIDAKMSQKEGLERLKALAERLHIDPSAIKVRPAPGTRTGISLVVAIAGGSIAKVCDSQTTKTKNFVCLVLWLGDLVRNIERGIETFREAFYNEGGRELALRDGVYDGLRVNEYDGEATHDDSIQRLERSLRRLGLTEDDAKLEWDPNTNVAKLRLRLRSGRLVEKASSRQRDISKNVHVLALWLQTKAKNKERKLEPDLETLFAANLLPA